MAKRALLVGINAYPGCPLSGCVNDVQDLADLLVSKYGFRSSEIRMVTDARATTAAVRERLKWLVTGSTPQDTLVFHNSTHGAQLPTRTPGGEPDGLDEAVCCVDWDWTEAHALRDKEFRQIFSAVPAGAEFIWIADSCHSGDLTRGMHGASNPMARTYPMPADIQWRLRACKDSGIKALTMEKAVSALNVALISGCRSDQTSADAWFASRANGALSYFLMKELKKTTTKSIPLTQIVTNVRKALKAAKYDQIPQLEGSSAIQALSFLKG